MSTLGKAIQIAATAFKDDLDKGGTPYIMHLLYVMYKVKHLDYIRLLASNPIAKAIKLADLEHNS